MNGSVVRCVFDAPLSVSRLGGDFSLLRSLDGEEKVSPMMCDKTRPPRRSHHRIRSIPEAAVSKRKEQDLAGIVESGNWNRAITETS